MTAWSPGESRGRAPGGPSRRALQMRATRTWKTSCYISVGEKATQIQNAVSRNRKLASVRQAEHVVSGCHFVRLVVTGSGWSLMSHPGGKTGVMLRACRDPLVPSLYPQHFWQHALNLKIDPPRLKAACGFRSSCDR
eukprot:2379294-Pyramimonas_sp.AAC.1